MTLLAIAAIGTDRPGIVAGLAEVLYAHGGNLEDTSMTILRGHFAMTLLVSGDLDVEQLDDALGAVGRDLGLTLTVHEIPDEQDSAAGRPYLVSVYGADHPGIVARIARLLADHEVNITDLTTRLVDSGPDPLYAMVLEVALPPAADATALAGALEQLAAELDVDATIHAAEPDIL